MDADHGDWLDASDGTHFRNVLGYYPTGVVVVTTIEAGRPFGFTVGSFTSVSLDPPLVGFLAKGASSTLSVIRRTAAFCVNVLASDQTELCWRFARGDPMTDRYADVTWTVGPGGSPMIESALAGIDCAVEGVVDMGDHRFVLGRAIALRADCERAPTGPLLFYRGALGRLADQMA